MVIFVTPEFTSHPQANVYSRHVVKIKHQQQTCDCAVSNAEPAWDCRIQHYITLCSCCRRDTAGSPTIPRQVGNNLPPPPPTTHTTAGHVIWDHVLSHRRVRKQEFPAADGTLPRDGDAAVRAPRPTAEPNKATRLSPHRQRRRPERGRHVRGRDWGMTRVTGTPLDV